MTNIHPTAIVEDGAKLAAGVTVGPFCIVGRDVNLGENVTLHSHVVVTGRTTIGEGTQIFPFASIGHAPQDLKFKGEPSTLTIGKNNMIREYVTINPGTQGGGMVTSIGDNCLLMISVHVAHDCRLGNHVIMANNATLAGHVIVDDYVVIGGLAAVHQFVRIGKHAMIGGMAGVESDVIPFASVVGDRGHLAGLNLVGLKRRGFDRDAIHALRNSFKELFDEENATLKERASHVAEKYKSVEAVQEIVQFIASESSRSILTPKGKLADE